MAGFLYLLSKAQAGIEDFRKAGLGYAFEGLHWTRRQAARGPGKTRGCVIATPDLPGGNKPTVGYYPKKQKWEKFGNAWIGYDLEDPPKPADVQRDTILQSQPVKMADGNFWQIPVGRSVVSGCPLPKRVRLTADGGELAREVADKYVGYSKRVESIFYWYHKLQGVGDEEIGVDPSKNPPSDVETYKAIAEGLSFNYYISVREVDLLGLIETDTTFPLAIEAMLDVPEFLRRVKLMEDEDLKKKSTVTPA